MDTSAIIVMQHVATNRTRLWMIASAQCTVARIILSTMASRINSAWNQSWGYLHYADPASGNDKQVDKAIQEPMASPDTVSPDM